MPSLSSYLGLPPRSSNAAAGLRPRIPRPYEGVLAHSFERVGGIGEDLGSHDLAVPEPVEPDARLDISFPALLRPQVSSGTTTRSFSASKTPSMSGRKASNWLRNWPTIPLKPSGPRYVPPQGRDSGTMTSASPSISAVAPSRSC